MLKKMNIKRYAALFLSVYLCFIAISIIHHHHFDLNQSSSFNKSQQENDSALLDFLGDGAGICAVNYFAQTISNADFSSDNLKLILTDLGINPPTKSISYNKKEIINTNSLRAPPEVS